MTIIDHPIIRTKLTHLREKTTSIEQFRYRMRELSKLMVFPVTASIAVIDKPVLTPLTETVGAQLSQPIVLVPILRAALGMTDGFLSILSDAVVSHLGVYREKDTKQPIQYYENIPSFISDSTVIILDPMLATGGSATAAISKIKQHGGRHIKFVCIIAAPEGVDAVLSEHPDVPLYTASLDDHLNERAYIVPGLGDAGDRYFGTY